MRRICARMRSDSCKKEPATSPEASYSMEASKTAKGVGMGICIGYESAYEFWRRADDGRACLLQTDRARSSYEMTGIALRRKTSRADIERARAFGFDDEPLHAVVPDSSSRFRCKGVVCHVCSMSLPRGSLVSLDDGLVVASPALAFLHMAESLSVEELAVVGSTLCGRYRMSGEGLMGSRRRLESATRLAAFVGRAAGVRGAQKARRALRFVVDDSASPMETALALLLCLPVSLGGYGLPRPVMNMRIDAAEYGCDMTGSLRVPRFFKGDLCWPEAKLCVEYDSDAHHTGSERIAHDSWRRGELELTGFMVVTVTRRQLYDRAAMDRLVRLLAKRLGLRIRRREEGYEERHRSLRRMLLWKK